MEHVARNADSDEMSNFGYSLPRSYRTSGGHESIRLHLAIPREKRSVVDFDCVRTSVKIRTFNHSSCCDCVNPRTAGKVKIAASVCPSTVAAIGSKRPWRRSPTCARERGEWKIKLGITVGCRGTLIQFSPCSTTWVNPTVGNWHAHDTALKFFDRPYGILTDDPIFLQTRYGRQLQ